MRLLKLAAVVITICSFAGTTMTQEEGVSSANKTMRPVVRGQHFAVASMKAEATRAAERILEKGGNAFDAIVAGQAVLGIVDAAMNGIGADATLLIYDSKTKKVYSLNAEGTAPRLATIEWYKEHNGGKLPISDSLLAGTVPGCIDAWYILLDRWGTMSFAEVLKEAIDLADNGFPVGDSLARAFTVPVADKKLHKYPTTVKLYYTNNRPPQAGEIFRNPDLARTLKRLVEAETQNKSKGRHEALKAARDRFYKGDIAREMAKFSEENGGLFRYEDFANYTAKIEEPISIDYHGYQIYKNASASQGPAELFALRILEGYDLKALGHNSADYIHTSVEATKLAFADRDKYLGDLDFIKIPYEGLLSKEYAAERRAMIDKNTASLEFRPGTAEKFASDKTPLDRPVKVTVAGEGDHDGDTSYIAVVDSSRNLITFTPSLHSAFGTGVVMGNLGFIFNCRGDYYTLEKGEANALAPGKRPRSTLQGTLVMKDGQPHMVIGTPGADAQVLLTMQTLLNMIDFGMNVQQAIEAPKWLTRAFPASPFPHTMYPGDLSVEARVPESVRKELLARGHKLKVHGPWQDGSLAAIVIDPKTGVISAGSDPRTEAYAWAW
ncbi:MAG TPA: gamma-glutamyltransferase [Pyrinomonadaceae bacterium]|nr:gamma-glutamyltransferase [Pyrinomonadaceae bacterium]